MRRAVSCHASPQRKSFLHNRLFAQKKRLEFFFPTKSKHHCSETQSQVVTHGHVLGDREYTSNWPPFFKAAGVFFFITTKESCLQRKKKAYMVHISRQRENKDKDYFATAKRELEETTLK